MDIVIAAERPSIAKLLSEFTHRDIDPEDIRLTENPDETGSFYIGWQFERYVLSPDGRIASTKRTDGLRTRVSYRRR